MDEGKAHDRRVSLVFDQIVAKAVKQVANALWRRRYKSCGCRIVAIGSDEDLNLSQLTWPFVLTVTPG
ncbi:MAG: hypothetical protein QM589_11165 [Thermomicrobiales bacterium]